MALYLGSGERFQVYLGRNLYNLNLFVKSPDINNAVLLSSDNYILKDINGVYLLPRDYIESFINDD